MDICLLDMAELTVERDGSRGCVRSSSGELVAMVDDLSGVDDREVFLRACDAALAVGRVRRPRADGSLGRFGVGLYNPYTFEVAVRKLPGTWAFGDGSPVSLPAGGAVARASQDGVVVDGRHLCRLEPDVHRFARAREAHRP